MACLQAEENKEQCDATEADTSRAELGKGQEILPEYLYLVTSPENSDMDTDSNRRQH